MPTQPMMPATETAQAVMSVEATITTPLTSGTLTPMAIASSSPAERASILWRNMNSSAIEAMTAGSTTATSTLSPLFKLPINQNVMEGRTLSVSATVLMMEMSA